MNVDPAPETVPVAQTTVVVGPDELDDEVAVFLLLLPQAALTSPATIATLTSASLPDDDFRLVFTGVTLRVRGSATASER